MQRAAGNADQEVSILKAIKEGAKLYKAKKQVSADGRFFRENDKKINALIKTTRSDFKKAEVAILRRANDQYRQVIFNTQMYAATGASYEKVVDMATKDFLRAGINCIEWAEEWEEQAEYYISEKNGLAAKIGDDEIPQHEEPKFIGKINIDNESEIKKEIEKFEREAVSKEIETACVITKQGEV